MFDKTELEKLKKQIQKLEKKDIDLIITDFDDTLFSTEKLLKNNYRKGRRGKEGNQYIIDNNLVDKIISEVYENVDSPKDISSQLRENHDLILTAGLEEIQLRKINALNLNHINLKIVLNAEEKILETIKYIVNTLKFVPNKITVYEDRPKFFVEHNNLLEDIIGTTVDVMFVEMDGNKGYKSIKKIEA